MNKKVSVAVVIAVVALGYLALKPKADVPATVADERSKPTQTAQDTVTGPTSPGEQQPTNQPISEPQAKEQPKPDMGGQEFGAVEDKLADTLRNDKALTKLADVNRVKCRGSQCIIEIEAHAEGTNVQTPLFNFIAAHPEYGDNFAVDADPENPRVTVFAISKEELKK